MSSISLNDVGVTFRIKENSRIGFAARYTDFPALSDISLDFKEGERVGLLGVNGAGKTTLLRVLSGILPPTTGQVEVTGELFPALSIRGNMIGEASCLENIILRAHYHGLEGDDFTEFVEQVRITCNLEKFIHQPLKTLSKGMRSRLIIALFFVAKSDILIFDEWIGVMDRTQFEDGTTLSNIINKSNLVVLASHKLGLIIKYCNRALVLDQGRVVYDGESGASVDYFKRNFQ